MSKIEEMSGLAEKKVSGFLSGKPIWVFWIVFTVLIGVVFGISYAAITILALRWWVLLVVIIVAGMASGSYAYLKGLNTGGPGESVGP